MTSLFSVSTSSDKVSSALIMQQQTFNPPRQPEDLVTLLLAWEFCKSWVQLATYYQPALDEGRVFASSSSATQPLYPRVYAFQKTLSPFQDVPGSNAGTGCNFSILQRKRPLANISCIASPGIPSQQDSRRRATVSIDSYNGRRACIMMQWRGCLMLRLQLLISFV